MDSYVCINHSRDWFSVLDASSRSHVKGKAASILLLAAALAGFNPRSIAQSGSREIEGPVMHQLQVPSIARSAATRTQASKAASPSATTPRTAKPQFTVTAGVYESPQTVYVNDATPGATIYYTVDGSIPTTSSPVFSGGITISNTSTLAAFAVAPGYSVSEWEVATYFIGSAPDSFIYNIAGTDFFGFEGDGGLATHSIVNVPEGAAIDAHGNVYIADTGNNRIRKVDASTGIITTIAGTGTPGFSGNGGPPLAAQFWGPYSLAFDSAGRLYVSDSRNNQVRRIDFQSGIVTAYAGGGVLGDGGPAVNAYLNNPL